jgi:alanine racemase
VSNPSPHSPFSSTARPLTVARIDLTALAHNLAHVRGRIPKTCEILAVVKADAYGHGAAAIARALEKLGVSRFGVATPAEGIALREAGIRCPILVMGALSSAQYPEMVAHRLTPIVLDAETPEHLRGLIPAAAAPYPVHIKVDTGMGRLGCAPEDVLPLLQSPPFKATLLVEGLMTHLADADNPDPAYTSEQLDRFQSLVRRIKSCGVHIPLIHAANSAAILCHPSAHFTMVRPGIMLYGYQTALSHERVPDLRPVLSVTTTVVQVRTLKPGESTSYNRFFKASRPTRIAVLPVGYADGYSRRLSNRGSVLLSGRRAPIAGRVCMDMTMVDVTEIPNVKPGDEAVLIGEQGAEKISAADLASWQETIPYEVLCLIGPRVLRVYG